jgi:hypothetical protein
MVISKENPQDYRIQPCRCQEEFEGAGDPRLQWHIDDLRSPKISFIQGGNVATNKQGTNW